MRIHSWPLQTGGGVACAQVHHRLRCWAITAALLPLPGCVQTLFVDKGVDCAEVFGRNATQAVYLDSAWAGDLYSSNHHTGRPLDSLALQVSPELMDLGVDAIWLRPGNGQDTHSFCMTGKIQWRTCMLRNAQHADARLALMFTVTTSAEDAEVLRAVQKYWNTIANCRPAT